jgi:hypothetical protein
MLAADVTLSFLSSVLVDTVRPKFKSISLSSSNSDRSVAEANDVVNLSITTEEALPSLPRATIAKLPATCSTTGEKSYECKVTVGSSTPRTPVKFSVTIADAAGNTRVAVTSSDGSKVRVTK